MEADLYDSHSVDIVTYPDPILRKISIDAHWDLSAFIIGRMGAVLASGQGGFGIAAPQVGHNVRIILIKTPMYPKTVMFNPTITYRSKETVRTKEGCLSIPWINGLPILRNAVISIDYIDDRGNAIHNDEVGGIDAAVLQHEIDHLDGILYIDRLSPARKNSIKSLLASI